MVQETRESNIYRDTWLRYLGYTNEVGEAFRSLVPKKVVWSSYFVACGYVLADTVYGATKTYRHNSGPGKMEKILLSTSDTLLWQSLASVIVPGFTINRICAFARFAQARKFSGTMKSPWFSTVIGLMCIPIIIKPIDFAVDKLMNRTFREWTGFHPHAQNNKSKETRTIARMKSIEEVASTKSPKD